MSRFAIATLLPLLPFKGALETARKSYNSNFPEIRNRSEDDKRQHKIIAYANIIQRSSDRNCGVNTNSIRDRDSDSDYSDDEYR